jgi:hypothetical protein
MPGSGFVISGFSCLLVSRFAIAVSLFRASLFRASLPRFAVLERAARSLPPFLAASRSLTPRSPPDPRHVTSRELARPGCGRNRRTPVILGREQRPVLAGGMFVFPLRCQRRVCGSCAYLSSSAVGRASIPPGPLKAGVHVIHDHGAAVDVSDIGHVHVHHGTVVEECAASPLATKKPTPPYPKP